MGCLNSNQAGPDPDKAVELEPEAGSGTTYSPPQTTPQPKTKAKTTPKPKKKEPTREELIQLTLSQQLSSIQPRYEEITEGIINGFSETFAKFWADELDRRRAAEKERLRRLKYARKRTAAAKELLETEETYVKSLQMCLDSFVDPLNNNTKVLKAEHHKCLFSILPIVYGLNKTLLSDLSKSMKDYHNDTTRIGAIFLAFTPYFRQYQQYLNNYADAISLLGDLKSNANSQFMQFYTDQRQKLAGNPSLDSLLILPIQRLPRYRMCLSEIIKYTESDHADLEDMQKALTLVEQITAEINTRMKEYEARLKVREIERKINPQPKPTLVQPHRRFITEGKLSRITRKGVEKPLHIFVFNDIFLYAAEKSSNKYEFSGILTIDDVFHFKAIQSGFSERVNERYGTRLFSIHSRERSLLLFTEKENEVSKWFKTLAELMLGVKSDDPKPELAGPLFVPDDWSELCMVSNCDHKFTLLRRRHHCRWCGAIICSDCGKFRLLHKTNFKKMVKPVCKDCYDAYHHRYRAMSTMSVQEGSSSDVDSEGSREEMGRIDENAENDKLTMDNLSPEDPSLTLINPRKL